ncbi:MAG: hypothetical protein ABI772_06750 [Bacteroidota bacterium]
MKRLLLLFTLVIVHLFSMGQDGGKGSKKVKKAEAKKEQQARNQQNAELKGRKRHEAIQDKATRKRMKRHRRGPIHVDAYDRRPFFLKRWFRKKENRKPRTAYVVSGIINYEL